MRYTVEKLKDFISKAAPFLRAMLTAIKPLLRLAKLSPVKLPDLSSGVYNYITLGVRWG